MQKQSDVIYIKDIVKILKKRKNIIYGVTFIFTIFSIVYVYFIAKPVYEVKANIECGTMPMFNKKNNTIQSENIEKIENIKENLISYFRVKDKSIKLPKITSIKVPKKADRLIVISSQGYDNNSSVVKLKEAITYLSSRQNSDIDSYIDRYKKLIDTKEKQKKTLQKSIEAIKKDIKLFNDYINQLNSSAKKDINILALSGKESQLISLKNQLFSLDKEIITYKALLSSNKLKRPNIIGDIIIKDKPIKPKKVLIIIVTFLTSLLFSVFLVFFIDFIVGLRKELAQED